MNDADTSARKPLRAPALLLVAAVALLGACSQEPAGATSGDATPETGAQGEAPGDAGSDDDLFAMGAPEPGVAGISTEFQKQLQDRAIVDTAAALGRPSPSGRPVEPGESVPLVVRYREGAEARHRITIHTKTTLRNDGRINARRVIYYTTSRVTSAKPDGSARIRLELTRLRYAFPVSEQGVIEIDSANITDAIQKLFDDNPSIALAVRPDMATIGKPVEFRIGPTGRIANVEGVEGWERAFLEAVGDVDPRAIPEAGHKPTVELLTDTWSHYLFPPLGGGELAGGATRTVRLREDTFQKQYVVHPVQTSVTHVGDETLVLQGVSTPAGEPLLGRTRSPSEESIYKTQVVASQGSGDHFWELERSTGFVNRAFHEANFQLWVAYSSGANPRNPTRGATNPDAIFTILHRVINVEREGVAPEAGPPDTGARDPEDGEETAAAATDPDPSAEHDAR